MRIAVSLKFHHPTMDTSRHVATPELVHRHLEHFREIGRDALGQLVSPTSLPTTEVVSLEHHWAVGAAVVLTAVQ